MDYIEAEKILDDLMEAISHASINDKPIFYEYANEIEALQNFITPWYVKVWKKFKNLLPTDANYDEIPF